MNLWRLALPMRIGGSSLASFPAPGKKRRRFIKHALYTSDKTFYGRPTSSMRGSWRYMWERAELKIRQLPDEQVGELCALCAQRNNFEPALAQVAERVVVLLVCKPADVRNLNFRLL